MTAENLITPQSIEGYLHHLHADPLPANRRGETCGGCLAEPAAYVIDDGGAATCRTCIHGMHAADLAREMRCAPRSAARSPPRCATRTRTRAHPSDRARRARRRRSRAGAARRAAHRRRTMTTTNERKATTMPALNPATRDLLAGLACRRIGRAAEVVQVRADQDALDADALRAIDLALADLAAARAQAEQLTGPAPTITPDAVWRDLASEALDLARDGEHGPDDARDHARVLIDLADLAEPEPATAA